MDNTLNKSEFLCPECGRIPEILNVHTDNNKIEFNCKKCGIKEMLIDDYLEKLFKSIYQKKCSECPTKGIYNNQFYFCSNCKDYICDICKEKHNSSYSDHKCEKEKENENENENEYKDHYFFNKCCICKNKNIIINKYYYCFKCKKDICEGCKIRCHDQSNHQCIEENKKKYTCLEHNQKFNYFCFDCLENFCEESKHQKHKNHEKKELKDLTTALINDRNSIKEINKELNNIVEFNETILKYSGFCKFNKEYLKSIINIGNSLQKGNERNSKDIKCLLKGLSRDLEIAKNSRTNLKNKKNIYLNGKEKFLHLNKRELDDQDFKKISQIKFNQLKEIDISENKITNVKPFKKMSLPFLEFLNLSYNQIQFIEPVTKLKSEKLQYIFLQNNKIEDMETFLESDFPSLKILRAECYNTDLNYEKDKKKIEETSKKINKKYPERFIYTTIENQIKKFKEDYKYDISLDNENIELEDKNIGDGDKMLKNLFLIITYKPINNIKKLILRNANINDPSILNRIKFHKLEILDLSVNKIENLEFLLDMKAQSLKYLYLDYNKIKEIYQILNSNFPNLELLSLNNNQLETDVMKSPKIYENLEKKTNKEGKKIEIQLKTKKDTDKEKK